MNQVKNGRVKLEMLDKDNNYISKDIIITNIEMLRDESHYVFEYMEKDGINEPTTNKMCMELDELGVLFIRPDIDASEIEGIKIKESIDVFLNKHLTDNRLSADNVIREENNRSSEYYDDGTREITILEDLPDSDTLELVALQLQRNLRNEGAVKENILNKNRERNKKRIEKRKEAESIGFDEEPYKRYIIHNSNYEVIPDESEPKYLFIANNNLDDRAWVFIFDHEDDEDYYFKKISTTTQDEIYELQYGNNKVVIDRIPGYININSSFEDNSYAIFAIGLSDEMIIPKNYSSITDAFKNGLKDNPYRIGNIDINNEQNKQLK